MDPLRQLAVIYGIKTSYLDMENRIQTASHDALLATLKALGAPISNEEDIPSAIRAKRQESWQRIVEPVIAIREHEIQKIDLHLPAKLLGSWIEATLLLENGDTRKLRLEASKLTIIEKVRVEGLDYVTLRFDLPEPLPPGYHRLNLNLLGQNIESLIISAPDKAYFPSTVNEKIWGAFIPLYALHSSRSWGAGDFSDLENLMDWVKGAGGQMVGTLPLMPSFFDEKYGPGPYMPVSRLFWNEFYMDVNKIPELKSCQAAKKLMESSEFQREISELRSNGRIDYRRQWALKRRLIEELRESIFTEKAQRYEEMLQYVKSNCRLEDYARFRATGERLGNSWKKWPERLRKGSLQEGDYNEKAKQYYLYSQFITGEQAASLTRKAASENVFLYLDLPVGVHPDGYDVWRERDSFVQGVNAGAPPDPVFTSGQNWSFPPLHPEQIREQGYRYVIDSLAHQTGNARMLRIDHMMNFHRLFWIPQGMENRDGVYVSYRAEELYAILALESIRHKTLIVGEDLGMVPPEVRPMMDKYGIFRMYVGQYELIKDNKLGEIPERSVASLNTHDMFPFASFWQEKDIAERVKLHLVNKEQARKELIKRKKIKKVLFYVLQRLHPDIKNREDIAAILKAVWTLLAASPAYAFLINLEDLWLETDPQNIPGTLRDENWSRKARYGIEEFARSGQFLEILKIINQARVTDSKKQV